MAHDILITVQGRVGADLRVNDNAGGSLVANFPVATTPRKKVRSSNEWVDGETQWYDVSAWRMLGEHCSRSLRRGDPVLVHGRLTVRRYTRTDGTEGIAHEIEALMVGHDLTWGTSSFERTPARTPQGEARAGGQADGRAEGRAAAA